jgi:hypothetical protein
MGVSGVWASREIKTYCCSTGDRAGLRGGSARVLCRAKHKREGGQPHLPKAEVEDARGPSPTREFSRRGVGCRCEGPRSDGDGGETRRRHTEVFGVADGERLQPIDLHRHRCGSGLGPLASTTSAPHDSATVSVGE